MYHIWYCVSTPRTVTERRLTLVNLDQASVGSAQETVDRPHVLVRLEPDCGERIVVGFFGAELPDPDGLFAGTGRFMRHVKLKPDCDVDAAALSQLIDAAYIDVKGRLTAQ